MPTFPRLPLTIVSFYILTETKFKITTVSAMSLRFFLKEPEP